jgi:multidrug resistance efflux pump
VGNYNWYTGQPNEIDVALIRANLEAATAAVQEAQWYAAALRGDPVPSDASGAPLTALQAAKDAVAAAQDRLESTRIVSPVTGVVGLVDIHPGEYASPGQVVVIVSDLDHLQVETTDLSELDLPQLQVGDTATVDIEALGEQAAGHIVAISPVADLLGGDVVYTVLIALDETPDGLRPGMTAIVTIDGPP